MGQAFDMLAKGLKEAFGTFGKIGFHKGLPSVKDIPVIIKALAVREPGVADEAHSALVWLTGIDCGRDQRAWHDWWREHGPEMARREAERKAAEDLFLELKRDVLTGRWNRVHATLCAGLRSRIGGDELEGFMRRSAAVLRGVYRDAKPAGVKVKGSEARVTIDWGEVGFDFREIGLVREDGGWRFGRLPWGKKAVRQPRKVETWRPAERPTLPFVKRTRSAAPAAPSAPGAHAEQYIARGRRRHLNEVATRVAIIFVAIGGLWGLYHLCTWSETAMVICAWVGIAALFGCVPLALLYCMLFGRLRGSREIREDMRAWRKARAPLSRGRR
jgi:hypothetical protein